MSLPANMVTQAAQDIDRLAEDQVRSGELMAQRLSMVRKALNDLDESVRAICETLNPIQPEK